MNLNIAVIAGDGIGPDITEQAIRALEAVGQRFGHSFHFKHVLAGGAAIDAVGTPLPEETVQVCKDSDAVLLGAVGGPKWDTLPGPQRPETGLLGIRKALGLYANVRPAVLHEALKEACPLKDHLVEGGLDMVVIRELTGGMYFGERGRRNGENGPEAYDTEAYSVMEVERIARVAFEVARTRKGRLTNVDKMNVLESSRLWRETVLRIAAEYPDVELSHQLVDNAAMQLVRNPRQFDVLLTTNMFGDILSDEASMITGSIGMLPSASLGAWNFGLYEPIHGSAPDIAGTDTANPIATILSAAMMLRYTFQLEEEARCIEEAVTSALNAGFRTRDIAREGEALTGTRAMGAEIVRRITG